MSLSNRHLSRSPSRTRSQTIKTYNQLKQYEKLKRVRKYDKEDYLLRESGFDLYLLIVSVTVILLTLHSIFGKSHWKNVPEFVRDSWKIRQGKMIYTEM